MAPLSSTSSRISPPPTPFRRPRWAGTPAASPDAPLADFLNFSADLARILDGFGAGSQLFSYLMNPFLRWPVQWKTDDGDRHAHNQLLSLRRRARRDRRRDLLCGHRLGEPVLSVRPAEPERPDGAGAGR